MRIRLLASFFILLVSWRLQADSVRLPAPVAEKRDGIVRILTIQGLGDLQITDVACEPDLWTGQVKILFQCSNKAGRALHNVIFQVVHDDRSETFQPLSYLDQGRFTITLKSDKLGLSRTSRPENLVVNLASAEWHKTRDEMNAEKQARCRQAFEASREAEARDRAGLRAPKGQQRSRLLDEEGRLSKDFQFDTIQAVMARFARLPKKTAFETEEAYKARRRAQVPERVAFKLPLRFEEEVKYNPEQKAFHLTFDPNRLMITLGTQVNGGYQGENAFGARRHVTAKEGWYHTIQLTDPYDPMVVDARGDILLGESSFSSSYFNGWGHLPCAPEAAKEASRRLAVVYSGFVLDATRERSRYGATLDSPVDLTSNDLTVNLKAEGAAMFIVDVKTRAVLAEYRFIARPKEN